MPLVAGLDADAGPAGGRRHQYRRGHCYYCRRNELLNCPEIRQLGIHTHGAFAQYVAIPARPVIPLGDEIADSVACLTEPFSCVVRASKKIGLSVAESVVVIGAGPVGNMHIQMARLLGAAPIIAVELNPRGPNSPDSAERTASSPTPKSRWSRSRRSRRDVAPTW